MTWLTVCRLSSWPLPRHHTRLQANIPSPEGFFSSFVDTKEAWSRIKYQLHLYILVCLNHSHLCLKKTKKNRWRVNALTVPQSAFQWPLIRPFTHTLIHQRKITPLNCTTTAKNTKAAVASVQPEKSNTIAQIPKIWSRKVHHLSLEKKKFLSSSCNNWKKYPVWHLIDCFSSLAPQEEPLLVWPCFVYICQTKFYSLTRTKITGSADDIECSVHVGYTHWPPPMFTVAKLSNTRVKIPVWETSGEAGPRGSQCAFQWRNDEIEEGAFLCDMMA